MRKILSSAPLSLALPTGDHEVMRCFLPEALDAGSDRGGGCVIIDAASTIYGTSVDESLFWTLVPGRRADDACTC